jgi:hypothetical protein
MTRISKDKQGWEADLPPLDRKKVGKFLKDEKARIAFRDGRWIPLLKLSPFQAGRHDMVVELIGCLVSGTFDLLGPGHSDIDGAIAQCELPREKCPVQALLETP